MYQPTHASHSPAAVLRGGFGDGNNHLDVAWKVLPCPAPAVWSCSWHVSGRNRTGSALPQLDGLHIAGRSDTKAILDRLS